MHYRWPGFPKSTVPWRPNALVIAPIQAFQFAFTASSLVHHPNNAPVILVPEKLTEDLSKEIIRLSPAGKSVEAQAFLIGPVSEIVEHQLKAKGLTTLRIGNTQPYETSIAVSEYRLSYPPKSEQGRKNVLLLSGKFFSEGMAAVGYAMHEGLPVLLSMRMQIPIEVRQFLIGHPTLNVYIVGSEAVISREVETQIRAMMRGTVVRISGLSPYETSVNFSRFFDPTTGVGWNRSQPGRGDAFSTVPANDWQLGVISGLFSHLGKHAPLLFVDRNKIPQVVRSYLQALNPERRTSLPSYMHAYVFGNFDSIAYETQVQIEEQIILREREH
nr:cell wall-binding repeat-containing protein [uncultured Bacillus sp.]